MVLSEILRILEAWAPKELAWERDNVGMQIGSSRKDIRRIIVALDVTDAIVSESRQKKVDLIITHHPLLFHPLRSVDAESRVGRLVRALLKYDIALYAAHTNLDFTKGGVNEMLARRLGLSEIMLLQKRRQVTKKISVFVPESHVAKVTSAMAEAGAGVIGNYESCSFRSKGIGTFKPKSPARPFIGRNGKMEEAPEIRLEMIAPLWKIEEVIRAMKNVHPYEEAAYDVVELYNASETVGAGAVGNLPRPVSLRKFLEIIRKRMRTPVLRYSAPTARHIRRVAVCGGSGSDLLPDAIREGADAFVTSDIRFHAFQDADGKTALIDAGHYETEQPVIPAIVDYLRTEFKKRNAAMKVGAARSSRNVVQYSHS